MPEDQLDNLPMIEEKGGIAFGVFSLAALCGVIFAVAKFNQAHMGTIEKLQGQRISQLETELSKFTLRMESDDIRERNDAATLSSLIKEDLAEKEALDRVEGEVADIRTWSQAHDLRVIERNSRQDTLLQILLDERKKP